MAGLIGEGGQSSELEVVGPDELNGRLAEITGEIREYTRSQQDMWRQLPLLALQAEGTNGYDHVRQKLYRHGMLHVAGISAGGLPAGLFGTFVDCATGNIVTLFDEPNPDRLADDHAVLRAWLPNGNVFNAEKWLEEYRRGATEPYRRTAARSEEELEEWRHNLVRELGLKSLYERPETDNAA